MKFGRDYKLGTKLRFKWYDDWTDDITNSNKFKIIEGRVDATTILNTVILYEEKENKFYAVNCDYILNDNVYETTN